MEKSLKENYAICAQIFVGKNMQKYCLNCEEKIDTDSLQKLRAGKVANIFLKLVFYLFNYNFCSDVVFYLAIYLKLSAFTADFSVISVKI